MQNLSKILQSIKNGIPVSLARFGDGETTAIMRSGTMAARGAQPVYASMALPLLNALCLEQDNYWVGIPCKVCQSADHKKLKAFLNPEHKYICCAVTLQNRNYQKFLSEVNNGLFDNKHMTFVSGKDQDATKLPFRVNSHVTVPAHDAFSVYPEIKKVLIEEVPEGGIVLMSCGCLSRALAGACFKARPDCSFICVGSIFDPFTLERKTGKYQQGTLPKCEGCN
jgi:hypothetical protein